MKKKFLEISKDASFFTIGLGAMMTQVFLIKEFLAVFYGNELSIGIILGSWLIWVGAGSFAGRFLLKFGESKIPGIFCFIFIICAAIFPADLYLIRSLKTILQIGQGEVIPILPMFLSVFILLLPAGFFWGALFPLASGLSKSSSRVYIFEALGSMTAGLLYTFYLVDHVPSFYSAFILGVLITGICAFLLIFYERLKLAAIFLLFMSVIAAGGFKYAPRLERQSIEKEWQSLPLIKSADSPYGNIVVLKFAEQYSLYQNGNFIFSMPDPYTAEESAYLPLIEHQNPKKILMAGGGFGGSLSDLLKAPVEEIVYLEPDPVLLKIIQSLETPEESSILKDKRLNILPMDARAFIKKANQKFDLIILSVPEPSTGSANRFFTVEFYNQCKRILNKGGVLSFSLPSSENFMSSEKEILNGSIYHTLKKVFPFVLVTPLERSYFFASDDKESITFDINILAKRWEALKVNSNYFGAYYLEERLPAERVQFIRDLLENSEVVINSDLEPVAYFYHLRLWGKLTGSKAGEIFEFIQENIRIISIGALISILLCFLFVLYRSPEKKKLWRAVILMVASAGFSGILWELAFLMSFQAVEGYLYKQIGFLLGLFMAGMALGAWKGTAQRGGIKRKLIITGLLMSVFSIVSAAVIPASYRILNPLFLYAFLIFLSGAFTGWNFSFSASLFPERGTIIYGVDLLASSLSSFAGGTFIIPLMGIIPSLFLTGTMIFTLTCIFFMLKFEG